MLRAAFGWFGAFIQFIGFILLLNFIARVFEAPFLLILFFYLVANEIWKDIVRIVRS